MAIISVANPAPQTNQIISSLDKPRIAHIAASPTQRISKQIAVHG